MTVLDKILQFDENLFFAINHGWANDFLDTLMVIVTDQFNAIFLIAGLLLLSIFGGRKGRIATVFVLLAIGVNDLFCAKIIKPFVGRPRPCNDMFVRSIIRCSKSFSMPSNHASNMFTFAFALGWQYKKALWGLIPFATLVALSRVYVGVHYPLDITIGALIGTAIGLLFSYISMKITNRELCPIDDIKIIKDK